MKQDTMRTYCAACGCETDAEIRHAWVEWEHNGVKFHYVEKQLVCLECGQRVNDPGIDQFNTAESAYCYRRACRKRGIPAEAELAAMKSCSERSF